MSLIKSIMHQLGLSGDPAKNFTLSVPAAPDGTMKLARGNAGATTQDIMTVDAAGKVAFPQNPSKLLVQTFATTNKTTPGGGVDANYVTTPLFPMILGKKYRAKCFISQLNCPNTTRVSLVLFNSTPAELGRADFQVPSGSASTGALGYVEAIFTAGRTGNESVSCNFSGLAAGVVTAISGYVTVEEF
jgi:hypothetical protein